LIENSPQEVPKNVVDICQYGFTEMLNNVFDHSASEDCTFSYTQNYLKIQIMVIDHGIGVFQKIQNEFGLDDARSALLELSKGRLTTQPRRHSGEGIFFTSRMFERFGIKSKDLFYARRRTDKEGWLIETESNQEVIWGTIVHMEIPLDANWTKRDVFGKFERDDRHFRNTHVPIKLVQYSPGDELVSRSQAKRLLARFDEFGEVLLDFQGIQDVGRAFIDEIFRVYRLDHPKTKLSWMNVNEDIDKLIVNAMAAIDEPPS
jgi:anti-sigma regulatory factor (Ser/Thr protein kinase)